MAAPLTREFELARSPLPGLRLVVADTRRHFERHTHAEHGIGVIDAGGQRSASGRGPVEALRGEVITVNPGEVHDGVPMQGEARRWRMVYLDRSLWDQARPAPEWLRPVLPDARLVRLFDALFATAQRGDDALAVEERLAALLQYAPTTAVAPSESVAAPLRALAEARERLADDDLPPPSLGALAARAGVSRYRFLRAFAAAYGLPPHAWAAQQRLARAERLLAQGHAPAEAALAAGFADQSHLTRALRRFRGYTPGQLAAMARG